MTRSALPRLCWDWAVAAELQGDLAAAETHFARSLALHENSGDRWGAALMRLNLADIVTQRGDMASSPLADRSGLGAGGPRVPPGHRPRPLHAGPTGRGARARHSGAPALRGKPCRLARGWLSRRRRRSRRQRRLADARAGDHAAAASCLPRV